MYKFALCNNGTLYLGNILIFITHFRFIWVRDSKFRGTSHVNLEWEIPVGTPPGTYRLHHYGNYKYVLGGIYPYHGFTDSFKVT